MRRRSVLFGMALAAAATRKQTAAGASGKPALLGGEPVRTARFPGWPVWDETDEQALLKTLRAGQWNRASSARRFEELYANLIGTKHCLAAANGTSALLIALYAAGVAPGDEVIVPPYTFVATVNAVLAMHALPVFVDSDRETMQIDASKIEAAITPATKAILPVHLGGSAADLDAIMDISKRRGVPVIEDACQAHLAEWKKKRVGGIGALGCFSFQASKNLNCGEGGAVVTNDSGAIERCYAFHNNSRGRTAAGSDFRYGDRGLNLRMTDFQAALLLSQAARLERQSALREQNAAYLTGLLRAIPGITPARMHSGCTRNAYHLYMFRYSREKFAALPRAKFLKALAAEGIPASGGYSPLNKEPFLRNTFESHLYKKLYGEKRMTEWTGRNACPENDRLCEEAVWLTQTTLLGSRADMDSIGAAIEKVARHAASLL